MVQDAVGGVRGLGGFEIWSLDRIEWIPYWNLYIIPFEHFIL